MKTKELNSWVKKNLNYKRSSDNQWEGQIGSFRVSIWSDPPADRIRVHAEICDVSDVDCEKILKANFHSTQDVHYAIHKRKIYAVFTHWFSELSKKELDEAFDQILVLARNTLQGDYYSGNMVLIHALRESQKEEITKEKLKKMWKICCKETNKITKGKTFEKFIVSLFLLEPAFKKVKPNFRVISGEIDLLIKNKVLSPHWVRYGSPFLMVECKNTKDRTPVKEIRNFFGKLENHKKYCTLGFFFSMSGFERGCEKEQLRYSREEIRLALINGKEIDKFLNENQDLKEFLEDAILKSIK